jgi:glycosyltransferase involved in cell wall biosynthesis
MVNPARTRPEPPRTTVLLVAPYAPRGGGMGRIMEYLAQAGAAGITFRRVESRGGGHVLGSLRYMVSAAWAITRQAAAPGHCIVHVNMAEGSSVFRKGALLLLARALGLPVVLHLHAADIISFHEKLPPPLRAAVSMVFRAATVCVVLGEPWRLFLQQRAGVPHHRIETLRNGVPRPVLIRFPPPAVHFNFVFVGNLLARKGLVDLLHAAADPLLQAQNGRLVIAGGGDATALRRLSVLLGINGRVTFTGWLDRSDTTHLLAQAGALVLPAYHEALPLVLAEAASLGVPIITTPVGAIGEVFRHDENALLVAPGDRVALAHAMLALAGSAPLAARLGRQARGVYDRVFAMQPFVSGLTSIYARHCGATALVEQAA